MSPASNVRLIVTGVSACAIAFMLAAGSPVLAQPVIAQDSKPKAAPGRYSMTPAKDGFLRLDTQTGAVSLCRVDGGTVKCQSSADERRALEDEIARLSKENAELRRKLKEASRSTAQKLRDALPSDKEFDRALTFAEKFMRRMMRIMKEDKPSGDRI